MPEERESLRVTAVLDSNVILSGLAFRGGKPREILDLLRSGEIQVCISRFILDEVARSLREDFDWREDGIQDALDALQAVTTVIHSSEETTVVKEDPADNRILDCAVQGDVQYLVTGDRRHLLRLKEFQGIKIVSPAVFLSILSEKA